MFVGWKSISAAFAIFAGVVLLYLPTLRGDFVYDSIAQVLHSDYIHTPSSWIDVLTLRVVGQDELDRNRPLHLASLMLDAAIWDKNPFGYRLTSVLLHALNAAFLFLFIAAVLGRRTDSPATIAALPSALFAAFGAMIFALHPLVVEAIAEPSNREDLLVLLVMLIGLLCLAAPIRSGWIVHLALVLCSFFAVLAKESGVAVPIVFAAAAWLLGDLRRLLPGVIGGLIASVAFLLCSYVWRPSGSAIFAASPQLLADDLWTTLAVQSRIWTLQLWQIIWPWNLSAHYTADAIAGITLPVAIAVVALVIAAGVFAWRADRLAALGIAVYVLCLLPASNFAAQFHPVADRYLYVPLAGVGMVAAVFANRLQIKYPRRFAGILVVSAFLALLCFEYAANVRRQFRWQQPATLWTDALRQYPGLPQALVGVANAQYRAGDFQAARALATEAVMNSNGRWAEAWALRAVCEWQAGDREQALESLRQARELSRVYKNEDSAAEAMIFSREQLAVFGEMVRSH